MQSMNSSAGIARNAFDLQPKCCSSLSILSRTKEPGALDNQRAFGGRQTPGAADTGLLSPELAAGIGRVKGAKRLGVRIGNWLTVEQSRALLAKPQGETLRAKRVGRLGYGAQAHTESYLAHRQSNCETCQH